MLGLNKGLKTIKLNQMRKEISYQSFVRFAFITLLFVFVTVDSNLLMAQDSTAVAQPAPVAKKKSYVKNTFDGNYIIDNQSVMVPIKGTFEFDIQHRFGTMDHSFKDLFGLFASANMLLGFSYVPVKDLQLGFGATNDRMQVNGNLKYAIMRQTTNNSVPVSVTLFANTVMDTRAKSTSLPIVNTSDRFSYFTQLIFARKINNKFSVQVAPSLSYFNNLEGYLVDSKTLANKLEHAHFAIAFSGKYQLTESMSFIVNYDQPLTQHPMDNPNPNISFGLDMKTSGHDFQFFVGNYGSILPQNNNLYNHNDFTKGQFLIGFNISRLWNF